MYIFSSERSEKSLIPYGNIDRESESLGERVGPIGNCCESNTIG